MAHPPNLSLILLHCNMKKLQLLLCIVTLRITWDNTCKRASRYSHNPEGIAFPSYLPTMQGPQWFAWKQGHQGPHQLRWNQLSALQGLTNSLYLVFRSYWEYFEHAFLSSKKALPGCTSCPNSDPSSVVPEFAHPGSLPLSAQTGVGPIDSWTYSPSRCSPLLSKLAVYLPVSPLDWEPLEGRDYGYIHSSIFSTICTGFLLQL